MRINYSKTIIATLFAVSAVVATPRVVTSGAPQTAAPNVDRYAWAEACKSCHADIYASWQRTKHANAVDRLSNSEQQQACINCHTTGGAGKVERDGKFVSRGVQCEACHGPGAAHAADPSNKDTLSRTPTSQVCEACHSEKSPKFKGFFYAGMAKLSHSMSGK